jgi:hypothetical protein
MDSNRVAGHGPELVAVLCALLALACGGHRERPVSIAVQPPQAIEPTEPQQASGGSVQSAERAPDALPPGASSDLNHVGHASASERVVRSYIELVRLDLLSPADAAAIERLRRIVMRAIQPLQQCHSLLLARGQRPAGILSVQWTATESGRLEHARFSPGPELAGVERCYRHLRALRLPQGHWPRSELRAEFHWRILLVPPGPSGKAAGP